MRVLFFDQDALPLLAASLRLEIIAPGKKKRLRNTSGAAQTIDRIASLVAVNQIDQAHPCVAPPSNHG
jgi:hypothetical protein